MLKNIVKDLKPSSTLRINEISNELENKGKKVFTPTADCFLNGVTRKAVINICKKNKIKIVEKFIYLKELNKFDSCFITGTAAEITPVRKILKKKI